VVTAVDAMRRILRELRLSAGQTQTRAGISAAQLYVLQALADGGDASLSEIAARTMTDRTSVAAVVDRLVEAQLVSRKTATADRRRAAIAITRAGRSVLKRAPRPPTALLIAGLDALPDEQLGTLADGLSALAHAMGLSDRPAGMLFEDTGARRVSRRAQ
jgi:DNA-binding MarR family transcriptional regulator